MENLKKIEAKSFGDHRWYYQIMSRDRGEVVENEYFKGALAPSWTSGSKGEWGKAMIFLRPQIKSNCYSAFADYIGQISESGKIVLLKQVPVNSTEEFIRIGFREFAKNEAWNIRYKYDDQNFPEVVADIQVNLDNEDGGYLKGLSRQAKKQDNDVYLVEETQSVGNVDTHNTLETIFLEWRKNFLKRYPLFSNYSFLGWNINSIHRIANQDKHRLFIARQRSYGDKPIGFCYLTENGEHQLDMALSFALNAFNDAHRLIYRKCLLNLQREGVKWVNLGGSEEVALYKAKKRIWPHYKCLKHTVLIMDGKKTEKRQAP